MDKTTRTTYCHHREITTNPLEVGFNRKIDDTLVSLILCEG